VTARSAFGLQIRTAIDLPGRWRAPGTGLPVLAIEESSDHEIDEQWSGAQRLGWRGRVDGRDLIVEHGRAGDLSIRLQPGIRLHLSSDGERLLLADGGGDRILTLRLLLDSALFTASLNRGHEALHAGAVATDAGLLAVAGATGTGKSSLVAALLAAGCGFHTDDVLVLRRVGAVVRAAPGPPVLTVPHPVPAGLGATVADLGGESWLAVTGADGERPLAGIVCLAPAEAVVDWRWLLGGLLRFPRTPEREQARFEVAADLAATTPVHRLDQHGAPPHRMAAQALDWIRSLAGG